MWHLFYLILTVNLFNHSIKSLPLLSSNKKTIDLHGITGKTESKSLYIDKDRIKRFSATYVQVLKPTSLSESTPSNGYDSSSNTKKIIIDSKNSNITSDPDLSYGYLKLINNEKNNSVSRTLKEDSDVKFYPKVKRTKRQNNEKIVHFGESYRELLNISDFLEPLIKEISKAEQNESLFDSQKFDEMRSKLDSYMHSLNTEALTTTPPTTSSTLKNLTTTSTWSGHSTNSKGFIVLGGGEDDEGGDDSEGSGYDEQSGSETDHTFTENLPVATTQASILQLTTDKTLQEMGFVVLVDNDGTQDEANIILPNESKTTPDITNLLTNSATTYRYLDIDYYGPCLFCHQQQNDDVKNGKRIELRKRLRSYDFVILVQKHASGVFSAVLSLKYRNISFPSFEYIRVHVPLPCDCFVKAPNSRYIIAGDIFNGKYVLNNILPLYDVNSYNDLRKIHLIMEVA